MYLDPFHPGKDSKGPDHWCGEAEPRFLKSQKSYSKVWTIAQKHACLLTWFSADATPVVQMCHPPKNRHCFFLSFVQDGFRKRRFP
jgi:hypothetical protein